MAGIIGLTLAKINGKYRLDVRDASWDADKPLAKHTTGRGIQIAEGEPSFSGSFSEVIPKDKAFRWRDLKDFSVDIYDKETRSIVVASFRNAHWGKLGGRADQSQANTTKGINWSAEKGIEF